MDYEQLIHDRIMHPLDYEWRSHGIGMLRTYLDHARTVRLNCWHHALVNPGISTMHTHPWTLRSTIIAGRLSNVRWERVKPGDAGAQPWVEDRIPCGRVPDPEFALKGEARTVYLRPLPVEIYTQGQTYSQKPEEIHATDFVDGTATLMFRSGHDDDQTEASVFWPLGDQWGDASRETTVDDIVETISAVRQRLNL